MQAPIRLTVAWAKADDRTREIVMQTDPCEGWTSRVRASRKIGKPLLSPSVAVAEWHAGVEAGRARQRQAA